MTLGWRPGLVEALKVSEFRWQDLLQHLEKVGGETRSCGSFQALKFRGHDLLQNLEEVGMATRFCGSCKKIMVRVAGLVTVPGGS